MRALFTDGWNSFWHFFFGILANFYWIMIPGFMGYQLADPYEKNLFIDVSEFAIGFMLYKALSKA